MADRGWPLTGGTHHSVKLYENIERLKLTVDHILPLHGRMAPLAEPLKAIRQGSVEQQVKQKELYSLDYS